MWLFRRPAILMPVINNVRRVFVHNKPEPGHITRGIRFHTRHPDSKPLLVPNSMEEVQRSGGQADSSNNARVATHIREMFAVQLLPIICITMFSCSMAVFSIYHALTTKGDVRIDRNRRNESPHEEVGPTQITKLYVNDPNKYRPIAELETIKSELKDTSNSCSC